jgi:hypothetical protein
MNSWFFLSLSPLDVGFFGIAGPEETKNPAEKEVLRLIQIRLAPLSLRKSKSLVKDDCRGKVTAV